MTVEILFSEVCNLYGDSQNPVYLRKTLPDAEFVYTRFNDTPYFAENTPGIIYIGSMTEIMQRKCIEKLLPFKDRLLSLIDGGAAILATGNASEIFCSELDFVTEGIKTAGLGIFPYKVKTDYFKRVNGKTLGVCDGVTVTGFRSQFSEILGDNSGCAFLAVKKGMGLAPGGKYEGMCKNNFIATQLLGPLLALNPEFCEYFVSLAGIKAAAAHRDEAMAAFEQRVKEFELYA